MRTIVLGDIHLGSPLSRTGQLLEVLERVPFDRLVLNGDIFDDLNFRRLSRRHWMVLEKLRDLKARREVIWILGNHDGSAAVLGNLFGFEVLPEYTFDYGGRKVFVVHGDAYDDFVTRAKRLKPLRDRFYGFALWFDVPRKTLLQWAQRASYAFERHASKVKHRAVARGRELGAEFVVAGHTHRRERDDLEGLTFFNPSSWLTSRPAYVLFDESESEPRMVEMGRESGSPIRRSVKARVKKVRRTIRLRFR